MDVIRQHLSPGDIACDIGANKGSFVYWLSRWCGHGRVIAFEPQPELARRLSSACRALGLWNVRVEARAVYSHSGFMNLFVPRLHQQGASLNRKSVEATDFETVPVPIIPLDEYFKEHDRVALLKIDAEGAEFDILKGAEKILLRHFPLLIFECENRHLAHGSVQDVFSYLESLGYEGSFVCHNQLLPIAKFDAAIHQHQEGEWFWKSKDYCNNFVFDKPCQGKPLAVAARSTQVAASSPFRFPRFNSVNVLLWFCVVVVLTIARCIFITTIDLRVDEAYYWTWSKENVISYLDHPPLIAWLIRLSTLVFGDTNFGVRFPGLFAMSLMQLLLGGIVWRVVRDLRYVVAVVLMMEASLAYGLGMAKITPDIALIPCELAMLWSLVRLAQSNDYRWWLAAGLFGGLALLGKYTAVLFLPAVAAFVLVPSWRKEQLASAYLWLGLGVALLVFSPVLYWNAVHDWASFRFQLDRPAQVQGVSAKFLLDFVGQQFGLVGILLWPIVLGGTAMLAVRGYRERTPIPILLSTAVLFPLGLLLWHGLSARIGDSWPLFIWPIAFACAAINLKTILVLSPKSRAARTGPFLMVVSLASGIALVVAAQMYYIYGTANYLKGNDPIGKEAGFAKVVVAADMARNAIGAKWFATTDYRIYSLLRWHLRDDTVPIVQVNERRRYIGFAEPALNGSVGLYVRADGDPDAAILGKTSAVLQNVGEIDLTWRGVVYDTYRFKKLTNWKPTLSPSATDPFERAHPH